MDSFLRPLAAASMIVAGALASTAPASAQQAPIKIGIPTSVQLQVGRDTQNAAKLAIEEINAKGGLLGRKLEMVVADETENPEQRIVEFMSDPGGQYVQTAGFLSLYQLILQAVFIGRVAQHESESLSTVAATLQRKPLIVVQMGVQRQFLPPRR